MKRFFRTVLQFVVCFAIFDAALITAFYFWDTTRGGRASKCTVFVGHTQAQVLAAMGDPAGQLKLGSGMSIDGVSVPERWFYGPIIRWQLFAEPSQTFNVIVSGNPLLIGLSVFYHRVRPDPRDLVVDFDLNGRVTRIHMPAL